MVAGWPSVWRRTQPKEGAVLLHNGNTRQEGQEWADEPTHCNCTSTIYWKNRSKSMAALFTDDFLQESKLILNFLLTFRCYIASAARHSAPNLNLTHMVIISDGKKIFLEDKTFFLLPHDFFYSTARGPLQDLAIFREGPRVHVTVFPILIIMQ